MAEQHDPTTEPRRAPRLDDLELFGFDLVRTVVAEAVLDERSMGVAFNKRGHLGEGEGPVVR